MNITTNKDLGEEDCAVIFRGDGSIEILLPYAKDDDIVSEQMLMACAVGTTLVNNKDLAAQIVKYFERSMDDHIAKADK